MKKRNGSREGCGGDVGRYGGKGELRKSYGSKHLHKSWQ